jgi:hypothetical protein
MEWNYLREILLNRHRDRGFGADWSKREAASVGGLFHFKRNLRYPAMLALVVAAAALAGCGASARTWAAADCWKSTEKNYAKMNIDKRADIVNKCIDDKLR